MPLFLRGRIWYADYMAGRQRIQLSTRTSDRDAAEKFLAECLARAGRDIPLPLCAITLELLGQKYMEHAKTHKRSWKRDGEMLERLLGFFGRVTLSELRVLDVERYQQWRRKQVRPATVNRELALLKHMYNLAGRWDLYAGRNPVSYVKFLKEDFKKLHVITPAAEARLLACCPPALHDMVLFDLHTGLRSSDIYNLQWEDIHLDKAFMTITVKKTQHRLDLPLNPTALEILARWQAVRRGPYVFYSLDSGQPFRDLKNALKKALAEAKLTGISWHTFRHTFASRLIERGADIMTVKELLGHSTVVVTMRYLHPSLELRRQALDLLLAPAAGSGVETPARQRSLSQRGVTGPICDTFVASGPVLAPQKM